MASLPRTQGRAYLIAGQGPLVDESAPVPTTKDRIRDAVTLRCPTLDELKSGGVADLAACVLAILHEQLNGRASSLCGHRSPKHRREQLRGEDPLSVEDLAFLAIEAPRAVALALEPLARQVGCQVVPVNPVPLRFGEANARLAETSGDVVEAGARALGDGRIDDAEKAELREKLSKAERALAQLRASLTTYDEELEAERMNGARR